MATSTQVTSSEQLAMPLTKGAKLIGIGLSYCYELMKSGELKTFRVGRRRMVTRQALQEFVDRKQAEAQRRKAGA